MLQVTDPEGSDILQEVRCTSEEEVLERVRQARAAQPAWARLPVAERARRLEAAADLLEPECGSLAELLAAESGKPLAQAEHEVAGAVELLRANAQIARRLAGAVLPTAGQRGVERDLAYTRRAPLGLVAAILPFNFPAELFVEKCAAALAGGNAVIAKTPPQDPLTVMRMHDALLSAGVPAEVCALVHGDGAVGAQLASADGVDAVSLTGSTAAGIATAQSAARTLRRLQLELGGNNASLVLADADLELAGEELRRGRLLMNGQACSASKRILVQRSRHDELAERLARAIERERVGPARDRSTTVGPLIDAAAATRVASQVSLALAQGAELTAGDGRADGPYVRPCLITNVPADADVAHDEEIFGPVFTLIPVDGAEQALAIANASSYGLMASIFTADIKFAVALAERLQAGGVVINGTDNYRPPVIPFGGVKLSGTGREGAGYTLQELTREQVIVLRRFLGSGDDAYGSGGDPR